MEYDSAADETANAFKSINPRAPIYSSYPPAPPSSVPPEPIYPSEVPSVLPQGGAGAGASTVPANSPVFISTVPPVGGEVYSSSMPAASAALPSSAPPASPSVSTVASPRASQVPLPAMTADELSGILGEPGVEDAEARTTLIKDDDLDALLNALEEGESPVELEDIEEISDIDDLEVIEVD